jgi:hypothetical protein
MPTKPISFNAGEAAGLDELSGASPAFVNASVDGAGAIRSRPGIRPWSDFPAPLVTAPVVKLFPFNNYLIYVTDDGFSRIVQAYVAPGQTINLSMGGIGTQIAGTDTISVAVGRDLSVLVGGGAPQKVSAGLSSTRLGGGPPNASDVIIFNNYIVLAAADRSGIAYWAGPGEFLAESWQLGRDFREAEAKPDPLIALSATASLLFMYGTQTIQTFIADADETFAFQNTLERGLSSKDSIVRYGDSFAFLDDYRRFVIWDGHTWDEQGSSLSSPGIDPILQSLPKVDDCWGFRENDGLHDLLVWVFPTAGRTFAFDVKNKNWHERYAWKHGRWAPWTPTSFVRWNEKNLHLVGLADGSIAELSRSAYTDMGEPLMWLSRTGFDDKGDARLLKHAEALTMVLRRGRADATAQLAVRWRNDNGPWKPPVMVTLGTPGDFNPVSRVRPCGSYRTRQWEISGSSEAAHLLASAQETFSTEEA